MARKPGKRSDLPPPAYRQKIALDKSGDGSSHRKITRVAMEYSSDNSEKIAWGFRLVDKSGSWGWQTVAGRHWWSEILPKLQAFESMTWAELFRAAGGRSKGNNHHTVEVANLTAQAKKRLMAIQRDENVHQMFSLRLTGTTRIYGIRQGRVLQLLWCDTHHGDNARAVYPVRAR